MGIGYVDSVVVYNRYLDKKAGEKELYFGTRFDNVRVELTQGANQKDSGMEDASVCVVKIPNDDSLPKPYRIPGIWNSLPIDGKLDNFTLDSAGDNFFIITKKTELRIDIEVPLGLVESDTYKPGGFFGYIKNKYGFAFSVKTADAYTLIPRFEIGGR